MPALGVDEFVDSDPLLTFAEESVENHAQIDRVVPSGNADRLDDVERVVSQTQQELAQIRSEIATLVGAVEDMKKRAARTPLRNTVQSSPANGWPKAATATVGIVLGILIGMMIWIQLGRAKPVSFGATPREVQPAAAPAGDNGTGADVTPADPSITAPSTARDSQGTIKPVSQRRPAR